MWGRTCRTGGGRCQWCHAHAPAVELIYHIAFQDTLFDQDIPPSRCSFIIDILRTPGVRDTAIVDSVTSSLATFSLSFPANTEVPLATLVASNPWPQASWKITPPNSL